MKKKIKNILRYLQISRMFLVETFSQPSTLSRRIKIRMAFKGFHPQTYSLYDLKNNDFKNYISDFRILLKCPLINGEYSNILNNKLTFAYFFRNDDRIIKPKIYSRRKKIISFDTGTELENTYILSILKNKEFIIKGATGGGGNGIYLLQGENDLWSLNSKNISGDELLNFLRSKDDLLVYDRIVQKGFAHDLNPDSVNTIRVITMKDPYSNEVFAPFAGLRVGRKSSFVDNAEKGGYAFLIDVNTGITSKAPIISKNDELVWEERHPDSNEKIEGLKIPNWDYIKNEIIDLAQKNSFMPYVGWDVVPMEKDFLIIEGNNHPGMYHYQSLSPVINIEKVKSFYQYHGVI